MARSSHVVGPGSVGAVAGLLSDLGAQRVFLVTGGRSFARSGARSGLASALAERPVVRFDDVSPNPRAEDVERGVRLLRRTPCDAILAVGGGSVLDTAKLINACAAAADPVRSCIGGQLTLERELLPLIAIPTTAGTGAEATHFAAVYIDGVKHSLAHERMTPDHVVLDHLLTASVPPYHAAAAGIDALSQAIEAYWSIRSTEESRAYSREAIGLLHGALLTAVHRPEDDAAREQMLRGANLSGRAIDIARTTAPHALSYVFTSQHGVAHGHAVGLTLGALFGFNGGVDDQDAVDPRGAGFVRNRMVELCALLGCGLPAEAGARLTELMARIHLKTRLRDVGVVRSDLEVLARSVNHQRLANNPRKLSPGAIGQILEQVF